MTTSMVRGSGGDRPKVLAHRRQAWILETLAQVGSISVGEVAAQLGVSEMTIRRDMVELEQEGRLARTHGGAVRTDATSPSDSVPVELIGNEPSFKARLMRNGAAKRAIAQAAAALAASERAIALDVGTTTFLLAQFLAGHQHLKVFTNSVRNAQALGEGIAEVYLPGGRMRNDEMSISSPSAVAEFESLWFDIAFVGVSGLTADGIYDYSFDDTEMKRVYLRRSTRKVVLCGSDKFNVMSLVHIAPLSQFNLLITDAPPPAPLAAALAEAGVTVQIAAQA